MPKVMLRHASESQTIGRALLAWGCQRVSLEESMQVQSKEKGGGNSSEKLDSEKLSGSLRQDKRDRMEGGKGEGVCVWGGITRKSMHQCTPLLPFLLPNHPTPLHLICDGVEHGLVVTRSQQRLQPREVYVHEGNQAARPSAAVGLVRRIVRIAQGVAHLPCA